jgi:hypothetical protein
LSHEDFGDVLNIFEDFGDVLNILSLASFEKTRGSGIGDFFVGEEG